MTKHRNNTAVGDRVYVERGPHSGMGTVRETEVPYDQLVLAGREARRNPVQPTGWAVGVELDSGGPTAYVPYHWCVDVAARTAHLCHAARCSSTGVWRWESNGSCVPADYLAGCDVSQADREVTAVADDEMRATLAAYRAAQPAQPSAEEMYEMRAAFGAGTEVVDVISGRRTQL